MTHSHRIVVLVLVVAAFVCRQAASRADTDPDDVKTKQAQAHFKQGKAFLDAGVYDDAIREFEESYKLVAIPELKFDIGEAYRLKGDPAKALEAYRAFLVVVTDGELADTARTQVALLTKQISEQSKVAKEQQVVSKKTKEATNAREQHDAMRARRAHGRKVGWTFITLGLVGTVATIGGVLGGLDNTEFFVPSVGLAVIGLGYGIPKRLANSDPGEFKITPVASSDVKGLVLSGSF